MSAKRLLLGCVCGIAIVMGAGQSQPVAAQPKGVSTSGRMRVVVVDADGQALPGAAIHVAVWTDEPFDRGRDYTSDRAGQVDIELPATLTILRIWATRDHSVPLFANWWFRGPGDDVTIPQEFTFQLARGSLIAGVVKDEDGEPIEGAKVEVRYVDRPRGQNERPIVSTWLALGDSARITDSHGRWTLDNVPADEAADVRLMITHPDYVSDQSWGEMQQRQNVMMADLRAKTATIVMRRGIRVRGTVTDSDGKPVGGAVVVWGDDPYNQQGSQEVRTDEDGTYLFPALPAGPMTVTVVAQGWMPELKKIDIVQENPPLDFRLRPGKTLRVQFIDRKGKALSKLAVGIQSWRGARSLYNFKHPNVLETGIPIYADENGVYQWTWAPDDAVTYFLEVPGVRHTTVTLTADGNLQRQIVTWPTSPIGGSVTDSATGEPIKEFRAIRVRQRPGKAWVSEYWRAAPTSNGHYSLTLDDEQASYRVRIEADGYRSAVSERSFRLGDRPVEFDFQLEAAAPAAGRVVDEKGNPVPNGMVMLATSSQPLELVQQYEARRSRTTFGTPPAGRETLADGRFSFPAQGERYFVMVSLYDRYTERLCEPDELPGDLVPRPCARVEGHLFDAGQPVAGAVVVLRPLRLQIGNDPVVDDRYVGKTGDDGRFNLAHVPPLKCTLTSEFEGADDPRRASSESVPLDLEPGQQVAVDLGRRGAEVRGQIVVKGEKAGAIDVRYSLAYLVHKANGIKPPLRVAIKRFDWRDGWDDAWITTPEGYAYLQTLHHYRIRLDSDGRFHVGGVPAGDHELAFKLYQRSDDAAISPVTTKTLQVHVDEARSDQAIDVGKIEIDALPEPRNQVTDLELDLLRDDQRTPSE